MVDNVPTFSALVERRPLKAHLCSATIHIALLFCTVRLPMLASVMPHEIVLADHTHEPTKVIYYRVKDLHPAERLPNMAPEGKGGRPGIGDIPQLVARLGTTVPDANTTIVVRLPHPDATHQIIHQPAVPPEVRIKANLKLPNIVSELPIVVEKPIGPAQPQVMVIRQGTGQELTKAAKAVNAPSIQMKPAVGVPSLPVNSVTPVLAEQASNTTSNPKPSGMGKEKTGEPSGLIVLTAEAASAGDIVALPYGNSDGTLMIGRGPAGGGSPGGSPSGSLHGGSGGKGDGGDGSTGIGNGNSGGGGSGSGPVMIAAGRSLTPGGGIRVTERNPLNVFPIVLPPRARKGLLTVSTGPVGGGGLDVYGALKGGRIYTVYLPVPKKNWVLQYCASTTGGPIAPQVQQHGNVIQFQASIEAPDPLTAFDFKRVPVAVEKKSRLVILKGVISKDGSLENLSVYRGVEPELDQLALATFGKWKFAPALKAGSPVPVDILVGIPAVQ